MGDFNEILDPAAISKIASWRKILDHIWAKANGWSASNLSVGGTEGECSSNVKIQTFWRKLPLPRKIKIFGWYLYHNALPVGLVLQSRGLDVNTCCPFMWLRCRVAG